MAFQESLVTIRHRVEPQQTHGEERSLLMNWVERDAAVVWHGFTQMECYTANAPVIVERAEGRELIDVDGRRYLDAI